MARGNQGFTLEQLFNKIPEQYRKNITVTGHLNGILTRVHYKNTCGCETDTCFKFLYMRDQLDTCAVCVKKLKIKDLSYYLKQIPEQYHKNIEFLEEYIGGQTKVLFYHNTCKHKINTKILHLTKRDQLETCKDCYQRVFNGICSSEYFKEFDFPITIIGEYQGKYSDIEYNGKICGHKIKTTLNKALERKHFDYCDECKLKQNTPLNNIPEQYHKYIDIIGKTKDGIQVKYTNPLCGCVSETCLYYLSTRKQFDYCLSCNTSNRKKSINDYLEEIPEQYRKNITFTNDIGKHTPLLYKFPKCGCEQEIMFSGLMARKQLDICTSCTGAWNQLSKEDMINVLTPYLDNVKIVSGFPNDRTTIIEGICKNCKLLVTGSYFRISQYYKTYNKIQCYVCSQKFTMQRELYDFVCSLVNNVIDSDRNTIPSKYSSKNFELDIYCPDNNFAIEFNGLIWHSERHKEDPEYHYYKTTSSLEKNITLIHIWEDKFKDKKKYIFQLLKIF